MAREGVRDRPFDYKKKSRELLVLDSLSPQPASDKIVHEPLSPSTLFPMQMFVSPRSAHPILHIKRNPTFKVFSESPLSKPSGHKSTPNLPTSSRMMGHSRGSQEATAPLRPTRTAAKSVTGTAGGVEKAHNQDTCFTAEAGGWRVIGVCDGHGIFGHCVSAYLRTFFPRLVLDYVAATDPHTTPEQAGSALKSAFQRCSRGLRDSVINCSNSGSTCVAILWRGDTLVCGNVGDSRAVAGVLSNGIWTVEALSVDHKPHLPTEKSRIEAAGGEVAVSKLVGAGPWRVYVKGEQFPGIAMSRSLGDELAKSVGVSAEPDILVTTLSDAHSPVAHKFVIVASDGLWEFVSNIEAVRSVAAHWEHGDVMQAVSELVNIAKCRWNMADNMMDDITAAVAFFKT